MNKTLKTVTVCCLLMTACDAYLDLKPDGAMAVPESLEDCQALLDDYNTMNTSYPSIGDAASDDYYLQADDWNTLPLEARDNYVWNPQTQHTLNQWYSPYRVVYQSNQVLDVLEKIPGFVDAERYRAIKGTAHFFRAYAFHAVASIFASPYVKQMARTDLGIPLRLTPDISEDSHRSTLEATYQQILSDLKQAASTLPEVVAVKSRPCKAVAWAALARVYLEMGEYDHAMAYADSCLDRNNPLLDYSSIDTSAPFPFVRFNDEVIFHATASYAPSLAQHIAKVDTLLYGMYDIGDLRKQLYFQQNSGPHEDSHAFRGGYDGSSALFCGLTVSEVLLIRAECAARLGDNQTAASDLLTLYRHRYEPDNEIELAAEPDLLLHQVLTERRKELIFRGRRWSDLRRLNLESGFETGLVRKLDGATYQLPPNDPRYTMLIPNDVIITANLEQNKR